MLGRGISGFILILSMAVAACTQTGRSATKGTSTPGPSSPSSSSTPSPSDSGAANPASTIRESSSLDAARGGQSTATPASSPLKEIYFEYDRFDLRADARDILKGHADWLKSNPSARVEIEGHTDDRGTNEYNLALGAKRAQSAKDYLATLGIAGNRLSTISYGEELPVCKEATDACWQKNRRARFVVTTGRPAS
jgi:peptidoglycan-associated lipoprotein